MKGNTKSAMSRPWYRRQAAWLWWSLGLYVAVNLLFLTQFPFVHSDEPWLSGLSRNIAETGNIATTETFFDLKPRYPHAIKILFHLLQIMFMKAGGYHIFVFRLISLLFGAASLVLMYKVGVLLFKSRRWALFTAAILAVDVQFIYASHFARQEIIILFLMLGGFYAILKYGAEKKRRYFILLCVLTGMAVGIHPNSFILAVALGCVIFARIWAARDIKWKALPVYIGSTAVWAAGFVVLSLWMDTNFFEHYNQYGSQYESVLSTVTDKTASFPYFLQKLYIQISGTYYTPDIRFQFLVFGAVLLTGILTAVVLSKHRRHLCTLLAGVFGILAGIILIGRYNQTSIVFLFPWLYLLGIRLLMMLKKNIKIPAAAVWILLVSVLSLLNIMPWLHCNYQDYLDEITQIIPSDARVIGNLNSEYAFENGLLRDYRNLAYIQADGLTFADYVDFNNIDYIILSDELNLLYGLRPGWDGIYGELSILEEINAYTDRHCVVAGRFINNIYGVRAVPFINSNDVSFTITVYKIRDR